MIIRFLFIIIFVITITINLQSQTDSVTISVDKLELISADLEELDYLRVQMFNKDKLISQQDSLIVLKNIDIKLATNKSELLESKVRNIERTNQLNIEMLKSCKVENKNYYDKFLALEKDFLKLEKEKKKIKRNNVILSSSIVIVATLVGAIVF